MEDDLCWKMTLDGRRPFNIRRPSREDNLWWKTTFNERQLSKEDNIQWKTTFNWRRPLFEDNLRWKRTFNGRQPLMAENLQWETNFDGRRLSMEDSLQWKTTSYKKISRFCSAVYCCCGLFWRCLYFWVFFFGGLPLSVGRPHFQFLLYLRGYCQDQFQLVVPVKFYFELRLVL